jgi:hypothetical protein
MSNPNLVVVRAGDSSLHPLWLATGGERNWDLVVAYGGDNALRYPGSAESMVRIDARGPRWHALHALLCDTSDAWRAYEYVWLADDDLAASCDDINRMFELMAALDLHLAQPSFSWDSRVRVPLTLHNPNFALRYASFIDPTAAVFSQSMLRRATPTLREALHGTALGHVWPKFLDNPARQCAILDRIQVTRGAQREAPGADALPRGAVSPEQEAEQLLKKHGIAAALQVAYGGMDLHGKLTTLFDDQGERFIYKLCEGYLGCAACSPGALGAMFAEHTRTRRDFLEASPQRAPAQTPAPAGGTTPSLSIAPAGITLAALPQAPQAPQAQARPARPNHELVLKL